MAEIKTLYGRRHEEKLVIQKDMIVLRDEHGWSHDQIAEETEIPRRTVSSWMEAYDEALGNLAEPSRLTPQSVQDASDRRVAKRVLREQPELVAEVFKAAPLEARREIAKQLGGSPEVWHEAEKQRAEANSRPMPDRKRDYHILWEFEGCLDSANNKLREAIKHLEAVKNPEPGDTETTFAKIERARQMVDVIDEMYRSGKSIDAWANELWLEAH